jgi:hypothetical protein
LGSTVLVNITTEFPNDQALEHKTTVIDNDKDVIIEVQHPTLASPLEIEERSDRTGEDLERLESSVTEPQKEAEDLAVTRECTNVDLAATVGKTCSEGHVHDYPASEIRDDDQNLLTEAMVESEIIVKPIEPAFVATSQDIMEVIEAEVEPQDLAKSPSDERKEQAPADIILIGATTSQNDEGEWLVSPCRAIYNRLPPVSTCLMYCAVAICLVVMLIRSLTTLVKMNKAPLKKTVSYFWNNPWFLCFVLLSGTERIFLWMTVIFGLMVML